VIHQECTLAVVQSQKHQVIQTAMDGHMTNAQAAGALGKSIRQVQRLKAKVGILGPPGVRHGNAGRAPHNGLPPDLRQKILDLAATVYRDYKFSHLADVLPEGHRLDDLLHEPIHVSGQHRFEFFCRGLHVLHDLLLTWGPQVTAQTFLAWRQKNLSHTSRLGCGVCATVR